MAKSRLPKFPPYPLPPPPGIPASGGSGDLVSTNNLSDVASPSTALSNLGGIGAATTNTLTNKRVTKRVSTEASNATPSIDSDSIDQHSITALAAAMTSFTVTGTPTSGQELFVNITDNGTARALTFGSNFEASELSLPTTTVISTRLDLVFVWNTVTSKWRLKSKTKLLNSDVGLSNVDNTSNATERASTRTLTNARITKRAPTVTQSATPTINTDVTDVAHITGLAQAITSFTTNLTGAPVEGDALRIDITDNGTARTIAWGSSFESSGGATLPTTTVLGVRLDVGFVWNTVTSKWRCIAVA